MCGIVGYAGPRKAAPVLLDALEKLEYRGYDSAGVAVMGPNGITVRKTHGRLSALRALTDNGNDVAGTLGIGHTRWATHGEPSDINSHPHLSKSGRVALVHNGIIENYAQLRTFLTEQGYSFVSDTDTEVAVQLLEYNYHSDPVAAVQKTVSMLSGSYALAIVFADFPHQMIAVRKDSPLIVGLGEGETFIASDVPAILKYTNKILRLQEQELALLTRDGASVFDRYGAHIEKTPEIITWDAQSAEKGGYEHFMLKEIMEQPQVIKNTLTPRLNGGKIDLSLKNITDDDIRSCEGINIVACGSAYHVGAISKLYFEKYARIPVSAQLASEFRYADPIMPKNSITIVISQSGETLDTLFALREAKARGSKIISVVNVVGSAIACESDDVVYTWAGPEIAVATTKAYSAQLIVLYLLALYFSRCRGQLTQAETDGHIRQLLELPEKVKSILSDCENIKYLASLYYGNKDIFFMGRNLDYALALEGSLKLKEISYIHSEAYAAGELKHGTISLIQDDTLVVALCTKRSLQEKMLSNIREVKARGAQVIAITDAQAKDIAATADHTIILPDCEEFSLPSVSIVPLQLFAYYAALLKGCDIDKPRNLAKSVTVE